MVGVWWEGPRSDHLASSLSFPNQTPAKAPSRRAELYIVASAVMPKTRSKNQSNGNRNDNNQSNHQPPGRQDEMGDDELELSRSVRAAKLAQLHSISIQLANLVGAFQIPSFLTFQPTATASQPKLAFTPSNGPLLAFDDHLVSLLTSLDAIKSDGMTEKDGEDVRARRKQLVKQVTLELEALDKAKKDAWEHQGSLSAQEKERLLLEKKARIDKLLSSAGELTFSFGGVSR